jgi:plastocyanin
MISPPAKALPIRREVARPSVRAAFALGIGLVLTCLAPGAGSQTPEHENSWTLTVTDELGQAVPGAVLLRARSYGAEQHHGADRLAMSPLIIDQRNKRFEPFVSVTAPRRSINFPNSDDIRHHVYSFSRGNAFERRLYRANDAAPVTFSAQGVVALGCNIHDNMQAYVLVTEEPVAGPSDAAGVLRVAGKAPDDDSTLPLWHPLLNTSGEASALPFTRTGAGLTVVLPLTWNDPQAQRSTSELESLLRQFSREDP